MEHCSPDPTSNGHVQEQDIGAVNGLGRPPRAPILGRATSLSAPAVGDEKARATGGNAQLGHCGIDPATGKSRKTRRGPKGRRGSVRKWSNVDRTSIANLEDAGPDLNQRTGQVHMHVGRHADRVCVDLGRRDVPLRQIPGVNKGRVQHDVESGDAQFASARVPRLRHVDLKRGVRKE